MRLRDLLRIANRNLLRNKLRTFLTIMAIFVGSFTLVMTNGLGDGLKDYVENQVKNREGSNILFVRKKFETPDSGKKLGEPVEYKEKTQDESGNVIDPNSYSVEIGQMESLKKDLPEIKTITPRFDFDAEYITLDGIKKYQVSLGMLSEGIKQKVEVGSTISGTGEIIIPLALGKAFSNDLKTLVGRDVTIGYKVGQSGEMKTIQLKIAGVATKGFMANFNSFVDSETARRIYEDQKRNSEDYNKFWSFTFQLDTSNDKKIAEIKKKLDEKGFTAESFADQEKRTYDAIGILQIGLNFFAFIALLAASFGIINTLVVAVMERTKEIGLQKALGLGREKIFLLFTLESVLIGFWGAMLGVVVGIFIGTIANIMTTTYLSSFEGYNLFAFRPFSIIWVIFLVCVLALLAGVMPAFRASRLNPIEALRYE
ncbi:MAG TPA: FtsX-like permease family protein [Pyrinomonadaceae bacterium]|nr:FtsX-like permease family protein [Pyrinomonadaceae bacterium]